MDRVFWVSQVFKPLSEIYGTRLLRAHFFAVFVDWILGKVETFGATAPICIRNLFQLIRFDRNPDLYQASAVCHKLSTNSTVRNFRVVVAAMVRPDVRHRPSLLRRMLRSLVKDPKVSFPFASLLSPLLTEQACEDPEIALLLTYTPHLRLPHFRKSCTHPPFLLLRMLQNSVTKNCSV